MKFGPSFSTGAPKKPVRIKKIATALLAALILTGFLAYSFFSENRNETQLDWPASGQAAIGSLEDGLLASSSANEKLRPTASMAKVITALAIMKKQPFKPGQEGQTYNINRNDIANLNAYISEGGSVLPILIGMKLTQYQAMQRMLIASDNNMADMLAERIFGSKEAYLSYARNMLKAMGLSRTVVADASGFNPATVSTASELVAIGIAALKNPVIAGSLPSGRRKYPLQAPSKTQTSCLAPTE